MATAPEKVTILSYQVGFGDCFLLSFDYGSGKQRHILIDYGSTGLPDGVPRTRMMDIAKDIEARTGGKLDAIVATHRHKDHISGFATKANGRGTGDVIRSLKPKLVIQPWTEDPDLGTKATGPKRRRSARQVNALALMQSAAEQVLAEARARHFPRSLRRLRAQLSFLGEDNLKNLSAVKNLMTMAPNNYVFYGKKSGLARILPGVRVDVLGPPTVEQTDTIKTQRHTDPDEFWHLRAGGSPASSDLGAPAPLFPKHVKSHGPRFPINARWLVFHARSMRAEQLLQVVRMLDDAMNNTSVILLFKVGEKSLLFPGDAQIENWQFALSHETIGKQLEDVDLYKVGHHGSLNATPKSLWKLFKNRTQADRKKLTALMSTLEGKHGDEDRDTEVPRETLVAALAAETNLVTTQTLAGDQLCHETVVRF